MNEEEAEELYSDMINALYGSKYQQFANISQAGIVNQLFGLQIPEGTNSNGIVEVLHKNGHNVSFGNNWFNIGFTTKLTENVSHELSIQFDDNKQFFHVMSIWFYKNEPFTYNSAETGQKIWTEIKGIEIPAYVQGEFESMKDYIENRVGQEPTSKYTLEDYLEDDLL